MVLFKTALGVCVRYLARGYLGDVGDGVLTGGAKKLSLLSKIPIVKTFTEGDVKKKQ